MLGCERKIENLAHLRATFRTYLLYQGAVVALRKADRKKGRKIGRYILNLFFLFVPGSLLGALAVTRGQREIQCMLMKVGVVPHFEANRGSIRWELHVPV